jgi:hypothetical protein
MANINEFVSSALFNVLAGPGRFDFSDLLTYAVPIPNLKLLDVATNPFTFNGEMTTYGNQFYGNDSFESIVDGLAS